MPCPSEEIDYTDLRCRMVEQQLQARGISNGDVLRAMQRIPREVFVPEEYREEAYRDGPLPIGFNQTISQPYIVALMTELLSLGPDDSVLEIGTGSGYQAAVLQAITEKVFSIERHDALAHTAQSVLHSIGCSSVKIRIGDGSLGWPEAAPFNAIIVTSGAPAVPEQLKSQLAEGGRLVVPVGDRQVQTLFCIQRRHNEFIITIHGACVFVPLIGVDGWY